MNPWLEEIMRDRMKYESGQQHFNDENDLDDAFKVPAQAYRGFSNPWLNEVFETKAENELWRKQHDAEWEPKYKAYENQWVNETDTSVEPMFEDIDEFMRFNYPEGKNYYNEPSDPNYNAWAEGVAPNDYNAMHPREVDIINSLYSYSKEMGDDSIKRLRKVVNKEMPYNELSPQEQNAFKMITGAHLNDPFSTYDELLNRAIPESRLRLGIDLSGYDPSPEDRELSARIFSGFHGKVSPEKMYEYLKKHLRDEPVDTRIALPR